jgi:hypothetical protein
LLLKKFQVFLGNVATILSPVADLIGFIAEVFSTLPGKIALVIAILGKALPLMKKLSLSTMKTAIANQFNLPPPWGVIAGVAGAAAIVAAIAQTSGLFKADDMMYGNNMLVTKNKGAIALNNDDTIIAGTNLGGGRGRRRDDGEPGWLGKLISGINSKEVRFDSYAASGPQGIVNTERRQASNLFD